MEEDYKLVFKQQDIEAPSDRPMNQLTDEEREERASKINKNALLFGPSDFTEDVRAEHASTNGGFELYDEEHLAIIRSAATLLLEVSNY